MSLAIKLDDVKAVLLPEVGWVAVKADDDGISSLVMDAYEFVEENYSHQDSKLTTTGFDFVTVHGEHIAGPLSSILAVRY